MSPGCRCGEIRRLMVNGHPNPEGANEYREYRGHYAECPVDVDQRKMMNELRFAVALPEPPSQEDFALIANGVEWIVMDDAVQATSAWYADYDTYKAMYAAAARVLNQIAQNYRANTVKR